MAALMSDSLLSVSQRFLSPDILQKISNEINQPLDKTKAGLKSVIPTLLMGIVDKGSTRAGAESLVNMASKQTPPIDVSADPTTMKMGNEFLSGIFGSNLSNIVSKLGSSTGMNTSNISKMLGMAAPIIMGALGSKIKNEKMSATGLMNFLEQQKNSLSNIMPEGISGLSAVKSKFANSNVWPKVVLVALLIAGGIWWLNATKLVKNTLPVLQTVSVPSIPVQPPILGISALENFMKSTAPIGSLRRFRFEKLTFVSGTTTLKAGSETELNQIVATMKAYPQASATIEGYTDNIGTEGSNQLLSTQRALAVKRQLVSQGISAERISAVGLGPNNPIASNKTEAGRAANRRIEFIIRR